MTTRLQSRLLQASKVALGDRDARKGLLVLPPGPGFHDRLQQWFSQLSVHHHDYAYYLRDRERCPQGVEVRFSMECPPSDTPYHTCLLFLPKARELARYLMWSVRGVSGSNTRVLVLGRKRSSIMPAARDLVRLVGPVTGTVRARHCIAHSAEVASSPENIEWKKTHRARIGEREVEVVSLPGVFSHGRLDPGTGLLLETLRTHRFRRALDWGCGSGVVGAYLGIGCSGGSVESMDSSVAAVLSARLTMQANNLQPDKVFASDAYSEVEGRFDLIVSNPPFHRGYEYTSAAFEELVRGAPDHLTGSGRLVVVVGVSSPALRILRRFFGRIRTLSEKDGYRVIEAREPRSQ
ncbi:methyltransferase [Candidatus Fermentibacteria bacterium]|nr:methyltransferase [Candidatus Fermentibacteria bacterium]